MDTKRFSQEDLATGMQAANAQTGNGFEKKEKEEKQEKKESPKKNSNSTSGKRTAATAGVALAGGAAVGAAAMAARGFHNPEEEEKTEENVVSQKETISSESKAEPTHTTEPEPVESNEIDINDDGTVEIKGVDENGDGTVDEIHGDLNGDGKAEFEIKPVDGEENEYITEYDLDEDGDVDMIVETHADGTSTVTITDDENVINVSDSNLSMEPEPTDEPIAFVSDDPDDLFDDDSVVPSELDENGDLLAEEFENEGAEMDSVYDLDEADDMDADMGVEDIDMV